MPRFTDEEKSLLAPYVTDTDGDIFAVKGLDSIVGAVYARYSRAPGGFRETLLKEFLKEGVIDANKAQDLIERILIAYGDDSVGELEGAHVSFENISILATKEIEDRRIGGSPIEQSTRYVFYDQKDAEGNFRYHRPVDVMASPHAATYVETMDFIFSTYCELVEPMKAFYQERKPMDSAEYDVNGDGVKEKYAELALLPDGEKLQKAFRMTYNVDIRTKACDALRALLPIATKTNVGIFGNGRFFQHALSHCYTSAIPEVCDMAERTHEQLNKIIPRYVKRAKANEYAQGVDAAMAALSAKLFPSEAQGGATAAPQTDVAMIVQEDLDHLTMAHMLFPHLSMSLSQIIKAVRNFDDATKAEIIFTYIGDRKIRRDRPGRALEAGYPYTFDLCTDFGTYKDLERHRMCTQLRQRYTPMVGFAMPADLVEAGFDGRVQACVDRAKLLYQCLAQEFPEAASYATLHGSKVRWVLGMNDRALMHMIELRTQPAGHISYRKVCQEMHILVSAHSPWRAAAMKFADHGSYESARADSEAKQRVKEMALDSKVTA